MFKNEKDINILKSHKEKYTGKYIYHIIISYKNLKIIKYYNITLFFKFILCFYYKLFLIFVLNTCNIFRTF